MNKVMCSHCKKEVSEFGCFFGGCPVVNNVMDLKGKSLRLEDIEAAANTIVLSYGLPKAKFVEKEQEQKTIQDEQNRQDKLWQAAKEVIKPFCYNSVVYDKAEAIVNRLKEVGFRIEMEGTE